MADPLARVDDQEASDDLGERVAGGPWSSTLAPNRWSAMTSISVWATVVVPLLAQATDPLSGGAGWIGAGLLGLVLSWLMLKHIPDKDKQVKELVDSHNARMDNLTSRYEASMDRQRDLFKASLDGVLRHCIEEAEKTREAFVEEMKNTRQPPRRPPQ